MKEIFVSWADFKTFVLSKSLSIQYVYSAPNFYMRAADGFFLLACDLVAGTADAFDFEANFQSGANAKLEVKDSDNSQIIRQKTTRTGWHYEPRSLDFYTSTKNSLYNRKHDGNSIDAGTDYGDAVIKFFNGSGVDISAEAQSILDAQCERTQIDWQPTFEMDIIGATITCIDAPVVPDRAYAWVIVAPDIPQELGGSVPFMAGGWNLRFLKYDTTTFLDGRGVKTFAYDPIYNTNKIRVIIKHSVGAKIGLQFVAEIFKA